jgi:hypothetical protein
MPITYNIIETSIKDTETIKSETDNISKTDHLIENDNYDINDIKMAMQLDYNLNYNISYLNSIIDFYNIKKKSKNSKSEIINMIIDFEINPLNNYIVKERKRLFNIFIELKNHKFFNKFIIGSL